jgi:peptide/nickel transport system substrate-binding protein
MAFDFRRSRMLARSAPVLIAALTLAACSPGGPATPPPAAKQPPPAATAAPAAAKPSEAAKTAAETKSTEAAKPAAQAPAKTGRTDLIVASVFKPTTLDPMIDSVPYGEIRMIMDPLVFLTPDMKIQPGLATEWKMVEPATWELKLRQDVKFHNGDPFTAADVKFNVDRTLDPDTKSRQVPVYYPKIDGATVVDDYTVRIHTKGPWPATMEGLTWMRIAPAKYFQEVGAEAFSLKPMGSGPYKFVEWIKDSHITLEANDQYWRGAPPMKKVTYRHVLDGPTRMAQLLAGEVDLIDKVPPSDAATIKDNANLDLLVNRSMNQLVLGMNTFAKPFDDVRVRQAMNYAVNIDEIIQRVLSGYAYRNPSSVGSLTQGYDANLKPYPYDSEKAKQLLTEAGYPNGFETTFDGTIGRYIADKEVAEAVIGQLARVGVRVKYNGAEFNTFFTRYLSDASLPMGDGVRAKASPVQGFYMFGCANFVGGDFEFCNRLHFHSKQRGIYYNTPRVDQILDEISTELNREVRLQKAAEAQKIIQEEAPWIFTYDDAALFGIKKGLTWTPRPDEFIDVYSAHW